MKIYFLTVFFLINTLNLLAQNKLIATYENRNNTEEPNLQIWKMYIDNINQKSLFINQNKDTLNKKIIIQEEDGSYNIKYLSTKSEFIFIDKKNKLLQSLINHKKSYKINESIPEFKWILVDSSKTLNNYRLLKASTTFRGRSYDAWYSIDFPISLGPWKFSGLPGLIFEVYDSTSRYIWRLSKINFEDFDERIFQNLENSIKPISMKEFIGATENASLLQSKLPKGTSISSAPRNQKELKYEWEK